jgi:hypothetical protein
LPVEHRIEQGQGLSYLCDLYGFSPERIWDDPANQELRQRRADPNVLLPGDVVTIPDKVPGSVRASTGRIHRFVRKGVPALFRLQLLDGETPRASEAYSLDVGGKILQGTTDQQGRLEAWVPNRAQKGLLRFGKDGHVLEIEFGCLDPIDELSGVQKRLTNLGLDCLAEAGALGADWRAALRRFQAEAGLPETGEPDAATRKRLAELHDTVETLQGPANET